MKITKTDFESFMTHARQLVPGFAVYDGKENSYLMNLIDGLIFLFNPGFLRRYITTIISYVWFPKGLIRNNPRGALEIACHELVHAYDAKRMSFPIFALLYLFPVSLFLLALIGVGIFVTWAAFLPFGALAVHAAATAISFKARRITGFPLVLLSVVASVFLAIHFTGWGALWLAGSAVFLLPLPAPGRAWAELRGYGMSLYVEQKLFGSQR